MARRAVECCCQATFATWCQQRRCMSACRWALHLLNFDTVDGLCKYGLCWITWSGEFHIIPRHRRHAEYLQLTSDQTWVKSNNQSAAEFLWFNSYKFWGLSTILVLTWSWFRGDWGRKSRPYFVFFILFKNYGRSCRDVWVKFTSATQDQIYDTLLMGYCMATWEIEAGFQLQAFWHTRVIR